MKSKTRYHHFVIPPQSVSPPAAPCAPEDVENSVDCENATISIAWSSVPGAVRYMATLEEIDGGTTCCSTSGTGCEISELPCGQTYILHVTAEGRSCNSSQSEGDITRTGMASTLWEEMIAPLFIYKLPYSFLLPHQFPAPHRTSEPV